MAIHSGDAKQQLSRYHVGTLTDERLLHKVQSVDDDDASGPFLNMTWKNATLLSVEDVSKDSKIFRFALQRPDQELGLPIGQHIYVRLRRKNGEVVQRAYTPVSYRDERGVVSFLVKCDVSLYSSFNRGHLTVSLESESTIRTSNVPLEVK
jgi:nitrate reductase (NAD(P)H)